MSAASLGTAVWAQCQSSALTKWPLACRCVEMLIKEQMRKYKVKMKNINQLEAEESIVCRRLSLLQQTEVSKGRRGLDGPLRWAPGQWVWPVMGGVLWPGLGSSD